MYSIDELKNQNKEISQLCDVLSILLDDPSLHDNAFVRELLTRFKEKVWMHLVFEDNTFYSALLRNEDKNISQIARKFHDSAKEIKHCFSCFVHHWYKLPTTDDGHTELCQQSSELISLIKKRITYENEQMFPLIEK